MGTIIKYDYDLIVIGSGPSGQKAAIAAAKLNKKVAVVEKKMNIGGVCVNTGTMPSKSIREAVIKLTGVTERAFYGQSYRVKAEITIDDLLSRCNQVIVREINILKNQLNHNKVDVKYGTSFFVDPHTVKYVNPDGENEISGEKIIIAVGTNPYIQQDLIQVDNDHILDSDSILLFKRLPGLFPYGLYSIPEISFFGETEDELTEKSVPYESGVARYKDTARGQILGDFTGVLKILVHRDTRKLLGVHAIGTGATELIHIGQAIIALGGTVDYLIDAVFNYPTLAECYKIAALEIYNKIHG